MYFEGPISSTFPPFRGGPLKNESSLAHEVSPIEVSTIEITQQRRRRRSFPVGLAVISLLINTRTQIFVYLVLAAPGSFDSLLAMLLFLELLQDFQGSPKIRRFQNDARWHPSLPNTSIKIVDINFCLSECSADLGKLPNLVG